MRVSFYSRDKLSAMPIAMLRNLDIQTADEEKLVQEILNAKLQTAPVAKPVNLPMDKTDFKNIEDELEFQKKIDERMASARPTVEALPSALDGDAVPPTLEAPIEVKVSGLKAKIASLKKAKKALTK